MKIPATVDDPAGAGRNSDIDAAGNHRLQRLTAALGVK
jgi:hypothetical protein